MDSDVLKKYTGRVEKSVSGDDSQEAGSVLDLGTFGWLRGVRERCPMLELRKRSGNILAIGYGWLERIEFDPSDGIALGVPGQRVLIKGLNLNAEVRPLVRLFEGLTRHRVPWVCETALPQFGLDDASCVIESIDW